MRSVELDSTLRRGTKGVAVMGALMLREWKLGSLVGLIGVALLVVGAAVASTQAAQAARVGRSAAPRFVGPTGLSHLLGAQEDGGTSASFVPLPGRPIRPWVSPTQPW